MQLDSDNFTAERIQQIYDKVKLFVIDLFKEKHLNKDEMCVKSTESEELKEDSKPPAVPTNVLALLATMDESTRMLYNARMNTDKAGIVSENDTRVASDNETLERRKLDISNRIDCSFLDYIDHCKKMDVLEVLKTIGNETYEKEKNTIVAERITIMKDVYYCYRYFDVLKWWKFQGSEKCPMLSVAAAIVLGKPTHNGFQERVFSRGTYFDHKLKQRMKESNFEMSVLNSLTTTTVSDCSATLFSHPMPVRDLKENKKMAHQFFEDEKNCNTIFSSSDIIEVHTTESDEESILAISSTNSNYDGESDDDELSLDSSQWVEDKNGVNAQSVIAVDIGGDDSASEVEGESKKEVL